MGVALAEEARRRGAEVVLLAANLAVAPPAASRSIADADGRRRCSTRRCALPTFDIALLAAAVADYRPAEALATKRPKGDEAWTLELEPTADIARLLGERKRAGQVLVTFGAELGEEGLERKRAHARDKNADLVVFNDVSRADIGFDAAENEVVLRHARRRPARARRARRPRSRRRSSTRRSGCSHRHERRVRPLPGGPPPPQGGHAGAGDGRCSRRRRRSSRRRPRSARRSGSRTSGSRRWDEAEAEFRAVLELSPTDDYAHYALGRVLEKQGRDGRGERPLQARELDESRAAPTVRGAHPRARLSGMRAVVQRVSPRASVDARRRRSAPASACCSAWRRPTTRPTAERLAGKVARLRIFEGDDGKFDRSLLDTGGAALVVSQFTLIADTREGQPPELLATPRGPSTPSRSTSASARRSATLGVAVETGVFGARMAGRARQRRARHDRARPRPRSSPEAARGRDEQRTRRRAADRPFWPSPLLPSATTFRAACRNGRAAPIFSRGHVEVCRRDGNGVHDKEKQLYRRGRADGRDRPSRRRGARARAHRQGALLRLRRPPARGRPRALRAGHDVLRPLPRRLLGRGLLAGPRPAAAHAGALRARRRPQRAARRPTTGALRGEVVAAGERPCPDPDAAGEPLEIPYDEIVRANLIDEG